MEEIQLTDAERDSVLDLKESHFQDGKSKLITNAIIHRDYSIADDVHVRIFDNRVEVESPGALPAHVTPQNILDERFARNGQIVRVLNKFEDPPNKDVGEGLNTAFDAMKKVRLKPPTVRTTEQSVVVEIRHEPLASAEELVMDYLEHHDMIQNRDGRELCAISSENKMKDVFLRLKKSGLIERVPDLKGSKAAWRKTIHGDATGGTAVEPVQNELFDGVVSDTQDD